MRERRDRKRRVTKGDSAMVGRARMREDRMERKRDGQEQSSSCTARRGQQDWKRPMLDRDQLLSPTCLVDSQIIARSLHGPWTHVDFAYPSIAVGWLYGRF